MPPTAQEKSRALADQVQPWTASRCHRLLRQLQSKILAIQTLAAKDTTAEESRPKRRNTEHELEQTAKRVRHTYGRRNRHSAPALAQPTCTTPPPLKRTLGGLKIVGSSPSENHLVFPTPVWRRICDEPITPRVALQKSRDVEAFGQHAISLPPDMVSKLRPVPASEQYRTYDALLEWLVNLLRVTVSDEKEPHPKSLLAMCLRKVPACIAEIEAWEARMSKEKGAGFTWKSSSATLEMYEQLEEFGVRGFGWRPLKTVIRSHAIFLLSEAIGAGLLGPYAANLLVSLCMRCGCPEEAAKLADAAAKHPALPGSTREGDDRKGICKLQPLRTVLGPAHRPNSNGTIFTSLENLAKTRQLPVTWISGYAPNNPWLLSLRAVTSGIGALPAMDFLSTTMALLASGHELAQQTNRHDGDRILTSMAGAVVAAAIAVASGQNPVTSNQADQASRRRRLRRLLSVLEQSMAKASADAYRQTRRQRREITGLYILALARQLTMSYAGNQDAAGSHRQAREELLQLISQPGVSAEAQYAQTTSLAYCIAHARSRTMGVPGRDSLREILTKLEELALPPWFVQGLQTDAAFLVAHKTRDLGDLAFAESLPFVSGEVERTRSVFSGWRWEEGISEWVQSQPLNTIKSSPCTEEAEQQLSRRRSPGRGRGRQQPQGCLKQSTTAAGIRSPTPSHPKQPQNPELTLRRGSRKAMKMINMNHTSPKTYQKCGKTNQKKLPASDHVKLDAAVSIGVVKTGAGKENRHIDRGGRREISSFDDEDSMTKGFVTRTLPSCQLKSRRFSSLGLVSQNPAMGNEWDEWDELI
ncbi:hypothetical protein S40288_00191 [Stachybotrys chartarum IBT 40288]|nr:hypothetical protein S40288_00191 [Stachybotrys chartarum IBT 40288]